MNEKHKLEPAINWKLTTGGQQITRFDTCQLTLIGTSVIRLNTGYRLLLWLENLTFHIIWFPCDAEGQVDGRTVMYTASSLSFFSDLVSLSSLTRNALVWKLQSCFRMHNRKLHRPGYSMTKVITNPCTTGHHAIEHWFGYTECQEKKKGATKKWSWVTCSTILYN